MTGAENLVEQAYPVRKIQILSDRVEGHPLFYCHSADVGHSPELALEFLNGGVLLRARSLLFKVKLNPQRKKRVDIYMSIEQANSLGRGLVGLVACNSSVPLRVSKATPGANASGNMKLPNIVWSKFCLHSGVKARLASGLSFPMKEAGSVYVDLEYPDDTHIKMTEHEIHIGVDLAGPVGNHDSSAVEMVDVPTHELQRGRQEKNPIAKVRGDFVLRLEAPVAMGLGMALEGVRI